jgi:hypothetical protein
MKIIITESQLSLLKEESITDMGLQELYDRALKLKKVVSKNVKNELEDYYWFSDLQVDIDRDWGGLPVYNFTLKINLSIPNDEFYSKKLGREIHDKIGDVFSEYFPRVNKHTKYNLTGTWVAFIQDDEFYTIII